MFLPVDILTIFISTIGRAMNDMGLKVEDILVRVATGVRHKEGMAISEAKAAILTLFKEMVPEDKNFASEVCMYRDGPKELIQEIRGECAGWNKLRESMLSRIEEMK